MTTQRRYCLIAPCRDEAAYMRRTLDSVAAQTVLPALWVVVDDGSTDDTPKILAEYAARLPWLKIVTRQNRGKRAVGPGVIEAFYAGLESVDLDQFDYVCKLDLDLEFKPRYFETLIERMESEPRLGSFSGKPWVELNGKLEPEPNGDEMSVGMSKFYRVACFRQVGGFVREVMWDGIDCHRARMLGWMAGSSGEEENLRFLHLRPMGSSQKGIITGRQRHGFGQWFMGTGPVYMLASSVFRATHPPVLVGGGMMYWGYMKSWWKSLPRYPDLRFRRFLRRYQMAMLTQGKRRATETIHREQWWAFNPRAAGLPLGSVEVQDFPQLLSGIPRSEQAEVSLHADVQLVRSALHDRLAAGQGGWLHGWQAEDFTRYLQDCAYSQLMQALSLSVLGTVSPAALLPAGTRILHLVPSTTTAGPNVISVPDGFEHDAAAPAALASALAAASPQAVVVNLAPKQGAWLVHQLLHRLPAVWFVSGAEG